MVLSRPPGGSIRPDFFTSPRLANLAAPCRARLSRLITIPMPTPTSAIHGRKRHAWTARRTALSGAWRYIIKYWMIVHGRHASSGRLKIRMNTKLLTKRITSTHSRTAKTAKRTFRSVLEVFILFLLSMRVEEKLSDMTSESSVSMYVNNHVDNLMQKLLNDWIRKLASR